MQLLLQVMGRFSGLAPARLDDVTPQMRVPLQSLVLRSFVQFSARATLGASVALPIRSLPILADPEIRFT